MKRLPLLIAGALLCAGSAFAQESDDAATFEARVLSTEQAPCTFEEGECTHVRLKAQTGDYVNEEMTAEISAEDVVADRMPELSPDDRVIVQTQTIDGIPRYFISDVVRRNPLLLLLLIFVACTVVLGGRSGMRSLIGMSLTFILLFGFMLPRILAGDSPLFVAIAGSIIIMGCTFLISHGWNIKTRSAWAGTAASLLLTGLLASLFSAMAKLTGFADEETLFLLNDHPDLDTRGILLAGILIGSLGVLDDITISQSSAVLELRKANPRLTARELYKRALRIGSDHIAAAVNTLVLAYAGSSLPLLLLLVSGGTGESWWMFLNREIIAAEIVRTLVGSVGLLAAVPFTTRIAAHMAHKADISDADTIGHRHS